jgi:FKBP-type peptidyl-prolyl cis-trans isomerase FkpA
MSVSQVPIQPIKKGSLAKLWLALILLAGIAFGLAWLGAGQFKTVKVDTVAAGSGAAITELDGVIIEYTGRTENGTVFDTTEGRGPAAFLVAQVVPGFREALTHMQQGGRYKIMIPGRLAYGPNPPPGSPLGPNEDLSFDVHVIQVVPNAALQAGTQQPQ